MAKKNLLFLLATTILVAGCNNAPKINSLTKQEKKEGFELLFDGSTTDGWRGYRKDHFPEKWMIDEGSLHCPGSGKGESQEVEGGDIIFDKKYSNFHLKLEWKIAKGGNSGIFYLADEDHAFDEIWHACPEMQVLDNDRHPDADKGRDGNRRSGSLYDIIPADPQTFKGAEVWNQVELFHEDGHVRHVLNNETVVEYQVGTPEWEKLVSASKFPDYNPNWAKLPKEGYIGFQDHGDDGDIVWYRNIKIKEL